MVLTTIYVFIFYCLLQGVMAIEIFSIKLALLTTFMFRLYRPLILNSFTLFLGLFTSFVQTLSSKLNVRCIARNVHKVILHMHVR